MTAIRTIHACRRAAGLDEEAARDVYHRVTGKRSLKLMSSGEQDQVAAEFKRLAGPVAREARRPDGRLKLTGNYAAKLQALWIGAWNLGLVRNRDDAALVAFVKRQTGIDHTRFLVEADDAAKAIEAPKSWMARETGIPWNIHYGCKWFSTPGGKIASTQWKILTGDELKPSGRHFAGECAHILGRETVLLDQMTGKDWTVVMNELGKRVRARKGNAR